MAADKSHLDQVNRSGFPLQLWVEEEIRSTFGSHGWKVISQEQAWEHPSNGSSGFADLVLQHETVCTRRLVLECKRSMFTDKLGSQKVMRPADWIFLLGQQSRDDVALASCYHVKPNHVQFDASRELNSIRAWVDVNRTPASFESGFCVTSQFEGSRSPTLEEIGSTLLDSVVALAEQEIQIEQGRSLHSFLQVASTPVIVANATLLACRFDPRCVNVRDGTLSTGDADVKEVDYIRFRKALSTALPRGALKDLEHAHRANLRTIFVVSAAHIVDFLKGWTWKPGEI